MGEDQDGLGMAQREVHESLGQWWQPPSRVNEDRHARHFRQGEDLVHLPAVEVEVLGSRVPEAWGREIDVFETQIELRKKGKIEEKLFAETRLRRGAYGQRYDTGQRHDGEKTQTLAFPSGDITKGPNTLWDAPGMQRI